MASYTEISGMLSPNDESGFRAKVVVAAFVRADEVRQATDDGSVAVREQKRYAQRILKLRPSASFAERPDRGYAETEIEAIYRAVLIGNKNLSLAQINSATDAQIQTAVDAAFDFIAAGFPDPEPAP